MDLLQEGVDRAVIALWLGHESVETTQMHVAATLAITLQETTPLPLCSHSFNDPRIEFLQASQTVSRVDGNGNSSCGNAESAKGIEAVPGRHLHVAVHAYLHGCWPGIVMVEMLSSSSYI